MSARCARSSLARAKRPLLAVAAALFTCFMAACGPHICAVTIRAISSPAVLGVSYPDICLRSGDGAVDFDGLFWVPAPEDNDARNAIHVCIQSRYGDSPQPAPPLATLTLVDGTHVRWSDPTSSYLLTSEGSTERERPCG